MPPHAGRGFAMTTNRYSVAAYKRIARQLTGSEAGVGETILSPRFAAAVLAAYRAGPTTTPTVAARLNRHDVPHPQNGAMWSHREVAAALSEALSLELAANARSRFPRVPTRGQLKPKRRGLQIGPL